MVLAINVLKYALSLTLVFREETAVSIVLTSSAYLKPYTAINFSIQWRITEKRRACIFK
jgi:hypothetical protein